MTGPHPAVPGYAPTGAPTDERPEYDDTAAGGPVVPEPRTAPLPVPARPSGPRASGAAWLVRPVTHVPGVLHLEHGRLRLVSTRGVIFDATPEELDLTPVRAARGGFRLTLGGERLRLHVVRFPGAVDVAPELLARECADGLHTTGEPAAGSTWRELLARPAVRTPGWRPVRVRRACAAPAPWY